MTLDRLRRAAAAAACALATVLLTAPAWGFDLNGLMATLGRRGAGEVAFAEQRYVTGLDMPLTTRGVLGFTPPDRLLRRSAGPRGETLVVEGNTVKIERGGRTRSIALDSVPELLGMVEAMRAALAGDAALLQRHFTARLAGSPKGWSIDLTPRDARLAAQVQELRIAGQGDDIRAIEIDFRNGDRTVTTLAPPGAPAKPAARP